MSACYHSSPQPAFESCRAKLEININKTKQGPFKRFSEVTLSKKEKTTAHYYLMIFSKDI